MAARSAAEKPLVVLFDGTGARLSDVRGRFLVLKIDLPYNVLRFPNDGFPTACARLACTADDQRAACKGQRRLRRK
jgi:hypothetical protein